MLTLTLDTEAERFHLLDQLDTDRLADAIIRVTGVVRLGYISGPLIDPDTGRRIGNWTLEDKTR